MQVATSAEELTAALAPARKAQLRIAFVPTMGNLHAGHLALVARARELAECVVTSIYVNPLQFGPAEDFHAYPRTLAADLAALHAAAVDVAFTPGDAQIYPRGSHAHTRVEVPALGDILCGAARPGHFGGVTTVVCRLLHLVDPHAAVFGKKDYQQLLLVRLMAADLGMRVQIVGHDTVREPDGLALSSRNRYLGSDERARAPALYRALAGVVERARARGAADAGDEAHAVAQLQAAGMEPDYVSVRRRADLQPPQPGDRVLVVLGAARLGRARLIDNLEFELGSG